MNLYLKHRPTDLTQVYGNRDVTAALEGMLADIDTCPHSFLFHGPTGCGKTTLGRIVTTRLNCKGSDFREVDSADFRGIDTVREMRKQSNFKPLESPCRVWLIDECHKMTNDAQNALLKILEDTPPHVYFILCTTEPHKLLKTIRGRCIELAVQPLEDSDMSKLLRSVVKAEEQSIPKVVSDQIIKDSFGLPRNALQILDQVLRVDPDQQLEAATKAAAVESESIELCRALIKGESWHRVSTILVGLKDQEAENIRRHVLGYMQSVLLKGGNDLAEFLEPFYNTGFPGLVYACYVVVKH